MNIEKYWDNYNSDDSLTLLEYLSNKKKKEISLNEIISETGLDKLNSYRNTDSPLSVTIEGIEAEIHYAISLLTDIACLLLECKINGNANIGKLLFCNEQKINITATEEEHKLINESLKDFVKEPLSYDLCEMVPEEEMLEMASVCESIRKELYE